MLAESAAAVLSTTAGGPLPLTRTPPLCCPLAPQDHLPPTEATKALRLQRLPPLLVLYLMRFDPANRHQKIRWVQLAGWCAG